MTSRIRRESGFALMEFVSAYGINLALLLVVAVILKLGFDLNRSINVRLNLIETRAFVVQALSDPTAVAQIMNPALNPSFECVYTNDQCPSDTVVRFVDRTGKPIKGVFNPSGEPGVYEGFNDRGEFCTSTNIQGDSSCRYQLRVSWKRTCTNPCAVPQILWQIRASSAGGDPVPLNVKGFDVDLRTNMPSWQVVQMKGSLVFEDSAPNLGDGDYNESVFDFEITERYNWNRELIQIIVDIVPIANGVGDINNGTTGPWLGPRNLMMSLNGQPRPDAIAGINDVGTQPLINGATAADRVRRTVLGLNNNLISTSLHPLDNNLLVMDTFDVWSGPGGSHRFLVNTVPSYSTFAPNYKVRLQVDVSQPALNPASGRLLDNQTKIDISRYRFILFVENLTTEQKRVDIDLVDVVPTAFDSSGNPWGLVMPPRWNYPIEDLVDATGYIHAAYPSFSTKIACLQARKTNPLDNCSPTANSWYMYPGDATRIFPRENLPAF